MISSELPEVLGMSDRILVMHEGHVTGLFDRAEATQEKIMTAATQTVQTSSSARGRSRDGNTTAVGANERVWRTT